MKLIFPTSALLLLAMLAAWRPCSGQNVDTRFPIVRNSPETGFSSPVTDLFGYTLALHQTTENGTPGQTMVVVGAPLGQADGARLRRDPGTNRDATGVLYSCPIVSGPCTPLVDPNTLPGGSVDRRLYDIDDNAQQAGVGTDLRTVEEKRGQFLGVTLKSTGDSFMTCAHRWLDFGAGPDRSPYGVCYQSGRSLSGFSSTSPCALTLTRGFFSYGQCQAGTAGDLIDNPSGPPSVLLGAPGSYTWRGAVARGDFVNLFDFSDSGVGSGDFGWQGYEVITGEIRRSGERDFIVSVPRFNLYAGRVNIYARSGGTIRPVGNPPLGGRQIGSYYGFSLVAASLAQSGPTALDDLVVSAPLYSPDSQQPEYGQVYFYRNLNSGTSSNTVNLQLATTLTGTIAYGRFGHAMANLGDINGDGFEDIAISAPFGDQSLTGTDRQPGTVYIYTGTGDSTLINQVATQTIRGNELFVSGSGLANLESFGTSLSSGVDVDRNGINDLAIGAYMSRQVIVLRTRPFANLDVTVTSARTVNPSDTSDPSCMLGATPRTCFEITVQLQFSGIGLEGNPLGINYTLEVDSQLTSLGSASRVEFDGEASSGRFEGSQSFSTTMPTTLPFTAYLRDGINTRDPLNIQFSAVLAADRVRDNTWNGNGNVIDLSTSPVLAVSGTTTVQTQFLRNCTTGTVCIPNLDVNVNASSVVYEDVDGRAVTGATSIEAGTVRAINITVEIVNNNDDAFTVQTVTTYNTILNFIRASIVNEAVSLSCINNGNAVTCGISDLIPAGQRVQVVYRFQTGRVTGSEGDLTISFNASSIDADEDVSDNEESLTLSTSATADLFIQAEFEPTQVILGQNNPTINEMSTPSNLSSEAHRLTTEFTVGNFGPSIVPTATLTIFWPLRAQDSIPYLLYLVNFDGADCEETYFNALGLNLNTASDDGNSGGLGGGESGKKRRRRQTNVDQGTSANGTRFVSCVDSAHSSCVTIRCTVMNIMPNNDARVVITAYPDNRYFFNQPQNYQFDVHAQVEITGAPYLSEIDMNNDQVVASLEGVSSRNVESDNSVPAWAIIVGVVVGLVIIVTVVIVLYLVGFFKLRKVDKDEQALNEDNQYTTPDGDEKPGTDL